MVLFERHVLNIKNFILPYCAWCQGESINYYWVYACSGSGLASDCEIEGTVCRDQRQIQGRDPGGPPFLIFRPNWGPKGRKKFFGDRPPAPLSQFLDDQPPHQLPPPPPHPILRLGSGSGNDGFELSLTTEVLNVVIVFHCVSFNEINSFRSQRPEVVLLSFIILLH